MRVLHDNKHSFWNFHRESKTHKITIFLFEVCMFLSHSFGIETSRQSFLIADSSGEKKLKEKCDRRETDRLTFWQAIKHKKTNGTNYK